MAMGSVASEVKVADSKLEILYIKEQDNSRTTQKLCDSDGRIDPKVERDLQFELRKFGRSSMYLQIQEICTKSLAVHGHIHHEANDEVKNLFK